jgi:transposase-like protein
MMGDMATDTLPTTLLEAIQYFSDPDRALAFVVRLRWPTGEPVCPRCGDLENSFISTRRIWKCKGCKKQFSAKVGTIFEDSSIGFDKWLPAFWLIANSKNSISSYEVARALGVTQKTAWYMLHRIRLAMESRTFEKLSGTVESDETFIGGQSKFMHANARKAKISGGGAVDKVAVQGVL